MAFFYIYETKTLPLLLSKKDALKNYDHVIVSMRQLNTGVQVNFAENELEIVEDEGLIILYLNQETTSKFDPGSARIQVNIYYKDRERNVSGYGKVKILDNDYKQVMP